MECQVKCCEGRLGLVSSLEQYFRGKSCGTFRSRSSIININKHSTIAKGRRLHITDLQWHVSQFPYELSACKLKRLYSHSTDGHKHWLGSSLAHSWLTVRMTRRLI